MLDLHGSFLGPSPSSLHHILLSNISLLLYPSADSVVILDASSLNLIQVLPFFEAFPATIHTDEQVSCVSVDPAMKLIVAAMGNRIAAWSLSGVQSNAWRIHSTLVLPQGQVVTALDNKSGLLAVGTNRGLAVYTLIMDNDLLTWSQKWITRIPSPSRTRFSPSLMLMATATSKDNIVRLYSTTTGKQTQILRHPRPLTNISWRYSATSSRDDPILFTTTSDATLRVFLPVLDAPTQLQLHTSVDLFSSLSLPDALANEDSSRIFELGRDVLTDALQSVPKEHDNPGMILLKEIKEESWDLFLRILGDGSVVATAVANIDSKPPTLLRQFTLQQTPPQTLHQSASHIRIIPRPPSRSPPSSPLTLTLLTTAPLSSYTFSLPEFLDTSFRSPKGLSLNSSLVDTDPTHRSESGSVEFQQIHKFVRTPEGRGLLVLRKGGCGGLWSCTSSTGLRSRLVCRSKWRKPSVIHAVVLDQGQCFVTYDSSRALTLYSSASKEEATLTIDDDLSSLFSMPAKGGTGEAIIGITSALAIYHFRRTSTTLALISKTTLPVNDDLTHILPVDPMAWSRHPWEEHDVLLSISSTGVLAFWTFDRVEDELADFLANGSATAKPAKPHTSSSPAQSRDKTTWRQTGQVKSAVEGRGIVKARCSSAKKTALIVSSDISGEGEELTIWDSKESEFASGLEFKHVYGEKINDLDWTSAPSFSESSILAIGFLHHVELLCQQRLTYFDSESAWTTCHTIDFSSRIPYPINDSIWLANGCLLIGTGHQMSLYGQPVISKGIKEEKGPKTLGLFEYVARQNGPLEDYHPQMLLQCLLWEKVGLVKQIIIQLAKYVQDIEAALRVEEEAEWKFLPVERFFSKDEQIGQALSGVPKKQYHNLFNGPKTDDDDDRMTFSRKLVEDLLEHLEAHPLPHLTPNEQAHLLGLIQTTLEIDEQSRALDANGRRYLISMRSFYILNRRASESSPRSPPSSRGAIPRKSGHRERLRYRDMVWAFHSESQDLLLATSTSSCNGGKMTWADARALGIPLWLTSVESMRSHFEVIARNEYMAGEYRDPTACSLFYFALRKAKLVHGLWKQAAWHKEQKLMLKFLSNDFNEPRWKTAALKNAFALLSKQRFEYAAAFFLLGGALKDAINVCLKQLGDWQLAVALARVVEQSNDGPILKEILTNHVLPTAFREGNRWLGSWAFWLLNRRDLSVRILVTPLSDIVTTADIPVSPSEIGEPHYDDPSLALLFSQLKSKTLQAVKGTSEISGRSEFNFVLQIARVFRRMGCHTLALDLVRSWSFERPKDFRPAIPDAPAKVESPVLISPASAFKHFRRSSILIDMEIPSEGPTRRASPTLEQKIPATIPEDAKLSDKDEQDLFARKAGLGSLMKSAKQNVTVPEFDMGSFGF